MSCFTRHHLSKTNTCGRIRLHSSSSSTSTATSATATATATASTSHTGAWWSKWRRVLSTIVKTLRIPFVVISVYGMGYQQGIIDYVRFPEKKEKSMLLSTLSGYGVTNIDEHTTRMRARDVKRGRQRRWWGGRRRPENSEDEDRLLRVATVARHVLRAASKKSHEMLEELIQAHLANYTPPSPSENDVTDPTQQAMEYLLEQTDVQEWVKAIERLDEEDSWEYVLIHNDTPNAFVSEVFPRRIFFTRGLFADYVTNDDELALVLGHEVSHLVLGHSSETNEFELILRVLELFLLALDPTDGLLFFLSLSSVRGLWSRAFSRDHEREADELGIELTARACYDTRRAAEVFDRMQRLTTAEEGDQQQQLRALDVLQTHPSSKERYNFLVRKSKEENREKYIDSSCQQLQRSFFRLRREVNSKKNDYNNHNASATDNGDMTTGAVISAFSQR